MAREPIPRLVVRRTGVDRAAEMALRSGEVARAAREGAERPMGFPRVRVELEGTPRGFTSLLVLAFADQAQRKTAESVGILGVELQRLLDELLRFRKSFDVPQVGGAR